MKKLLSALTAGLFILGCKQAAEALDGDFVSDVSIASHGVTIGLDQDGDEFSVGAAGLTVSTSNTSQIGIEYASTIWGVTGSASYDYTSDDEHLLGFDTSTSLLGVDLDAGVDWNIDDASFAGTIGTGYSMFGLDGSATTNWDLDDFAYDGLDVDAGYLLFWLVIFWLGWTMLFIPYYAWAAELSPDYNERTTIAAWRMFLGMVANVATKVLPVVALLLFSYGGTKEVVEMIGWGLLFLIPVAISLTTYNVPEKRDYTSTKIPILKGLKVMWNNSPFKRLVTSPINEVTASKALFICYLLGLLKQKGAPKRAPLFYWLTCERNKD